MSKKLFVKIEDPDVNKIKYTDLCDPDFNPEQIPDLHAYDCPNIVRHVRKKLGHDATMDDVIDALDVLIAYICENDVYYFKVDVSERNDSLKPAKEMSIKDIEKELGYKIKIVSDKG